MTSSLKNIDIHDEIEQSKWSFPFNEFSLYSMNFLNACKYVLLMFFGALLYVLFKHKR